MVNFRKKKRERQPEDSGLSTGEQRPESGSDTADEKPSGLSLTDRHPRQTSDYGLDQELTELYRTTASRLFRYGLLLTRNASVAEDAVQETFVKFYVQRAQGEIKDPRAWLFRVLHNHILDEQRSHSSKMSVGLDAAQDCPDKSQSPERAVEYSEAVQLALKVLSPREIQCLQLRAEGFSYKEIAGILGIERGTVGALLTRSSEKIRRAFGQEGLPCEAL